MALGFAYILSRVQRIKQRWQSISVTEGLLAFATVVLAVFIAFSGLEMLIHFGWVTRLLMLLVGIGAIVAAAVWFIFRPILSRPTDEEVALRIETSIQGVHNGLINALRLSKDRQVQSVGMLEGAMHEIAANIQRLDFNPAIKTQRRLIFGLSSAGLTIVLIAFIALFPARLKNALARLANPTADIPALGQVAIKKVEPGDTTIMSGSDLKVTLTIERTTNATVEAALYYSQSAGKESAVPMSPQGDDAFEYEIPDVRVDVGYHVRVGGSESKRYKATVVEPPLVTKIDLKYDYPSYTGLPAATMENTDGNIEAVKGSTVTLVAATSKKIKEGNVQFNSGEQLNLSVGVDGTSGTARFVVQKDGSYRIFVTDEQGNTNRDPVPHTIKATADDPPLVKVLEPGKDTTVPLDGKLKFITRASDDFGVASMKLFAKVNNAETPTLVNEWKQFADPKTASANWEWPFPAAQYKIGDLAAYYVEVTDNCPAPNAVKSQEYKLTVEAAQKVAEELKQKYSDWEMKLDKVLKLQREARQEAGGAVEEK